MAYADIAGLLTRVRAIMDTAAGSLRTIDATRFQADYHDSLPADEKARRAVVNPRFDVTARILGLSEASPPRLHSLAVYDVEVTIVIARPLTYSETLTDSQRDTIVAAGATDFDVVRQALDYPGNLSTVTGLVTGMLTPGAAPTMNIRAPVGDGPGLLETRLTFTGWMTVTQATS